MSGRTWNVHQQMAIDARGKSVVVSAAAGSGKTSVLTERVLRLIEEGEDIENMLIVTFTNLAASEMRERIYKRLQDTSASSARLAAQAEKCAFADIATLHAFCGRLIRDHFEHAGTSPGVAIASEAETARLKQEALEQAIEQASQNERMRPYVEKFSHRGDMDQMISIITAIYNRAISLKNPQQWLDDAYAHFDGGAFVNTLFAEYANMVQEAAEKANAKLSARSEIWREKGFDAQADESENDRITFMRDVRQLEMKNVMLPEAKQISIKIKGAPNRESQSLTNHANKCFDALRGCTGDFTAKVSAELEQAAGDGRFFIELTKLFMSRYARAKRAKNLIDHDDTMHFALKALQVPDVAARYRSRYAHVFVDEYQDINEAQHTIISLIQRDNNDFLVGDVKQCIYTFRESNPDLLIKRCRELEGSGLIEMNTNYRSMPGVIEFINSVMRHMMTRDVGGVDYTGGQCLEPGGQGEGGVEIVLAQREEEENIDAEAREIGAQIKRLKSQGYDYADIAILRPEMTQSGRKIAKVLSDMNIPVVNGFGSSDADFGELHVFVNMLTLIHNETDDTAMLSVMRYPHFGFTEPELAQIRLAQPENAQDKSFCGAVRAFRLDTPLGAKVSAFRDTLARCRLLAACMKMPDFLMRLRQDMRLKDYALTSPGGAACEAAINSFISAAAAMNPKSLADVLAVADKLKCTRETQQSPDCSGGVYMTTIHKSKGLEFGVVILSGLHKKIDQRDAQGAILVGRGLGIAPDIIDAEKHIRKPTLHRLAVARLLRREKIAETVRLLYVGMTRAIERLIILGAGSEIKESWLKPKYKGWQHDAVTHFDLLMPAVAMAAAQSGKNLEDIVRILRDEDTDNRRASKAQRLEDIWKQAAVQTPANLFERYLYQSDIGVPSKVSVSALKRMEEAPVLRPVHRPSGEDVVEAATRGTLMHRVLEHVGLEPKSENDVKKLVEDMAERGLIDKSLETQVDAAAISRFLHSPLAKRARDASMLRQEQPFCLKLSAKEAGLNESEENVIVQGVIDMCFVENGSWIIVDYKTDRVQPDEAQEAAKKYSVQLSLYSKALSRITHIPVSQAFIYYLAVGEAVLLNIDY